MTTPSPIQLRLPSEGPGPQITQLYPYVELLSEGAPPSNSLFILEPARVALGLDAPGDRLLVIDPPADLTARFRLPTESALLSCAAPLESHLPQVQHIPGGVAHIRLGDQYLDIYSYSGGAIVHLPPLGVVYSGGFGSDLLPPTIAADSDGVAELDTLRLLARLLKQQRIRLLIPHVGNMCTDLPTMMGRLAADVAYLHHLRRILPAVAIAQNVAAPDPVLVESLLPAERRSDFARRSHAQNVERLLTTLLRQKASSA